MCKKFNFDKINNNNNLIMLLLVLALKTTDMWSQKRLYTCVYVYLLDKVQRINNCVLSFEIPNHKLLSR